MKLDSPARCPICDALLNGVEIVTESARKNPRLGDITVCAYCDTVLIFGVNAFLKMPDADFAKMRNDERGELIKAATHVKIIRTINPLCFFNLKEPQNWPKKEYWPKELHAIAAKTKPTTRF